MTLAVKLAPRYIAIENVFGFMQDAAAFDRILRMLETTSCSPGP